MDLLLRFIVWIIKEMIKSTSPETSMQQQQESQFVLTPEVSLSRDVRRYAERLLSVQNTARQQLAGLAKREPELRDQIAPALREGVLEHAEELAEQGRQLLEAIPTYGAQACLENAGQFAFEVQQLETVLGVTKELLQQRANAADRAVLGDADALARACYLPILEFARHHQLPIVSNTPMTLFYPGGTFIELAFIQHKLAPIGLPQNYRHEPWWWPAIAHEIAHDFYVSLPAIEPELGRKLDLPLTTADASVTIGTEAFDQFLFSIWLEELFADAVGSLMIGPAYLRAMTTIFRSPDEPGRIVIVAASDEETVDVHPPRHLRVHFTARFLHRQGFSSEARELVRAWDAEHNSPEQAWLVTPDTHQAFPIASLMTLAESIADGIYNAELQALAGHRLADIPGLDFSALHARRSEEARKRLAAGLPVAFDARALIAAATEASLDYPDAVQKINEATRLSIVGIGTGERRAHVRALAAGASVRFTGTRAKRRQRIVEAMLLEEILERPLGQRGFRS
jgi:hypothetical protein